MNAWQWLKGAHFVRGFLWMLVAFNLIGNGIAWLLIGRLSLSEWPLALLPFVWLAISVPAALFVGVAWNSIEGQRDRYNAWADHFCAARSSLAHHLRDHPDVVSVDAWLDGRLYLFVKAAPYGHPFPNVWDGVSVEIRVAPMAEWPHIGA